MKLHQFLSSTRRVLAVIPVMVVLLAGASSAMAQVAPTFPTKSVVTIVVTGTVPGPPEDVAFNKVGIEIGSTLSRDADPAVPPQLIIDMNFLKAAGVGLTTKKKYIADAQVTMVRPLTSTAVLEITFPFVENKTTALTSAESTKFLSEAPAGLATFNLTFDTNGVITGASGTIGANKFASAP